MQSKIEKPDVVESTALPRIAILEKRRDRTAFETDILWNAGYPVDVYNAPDAIETSLKAGTKPAILLLELNWDDPTFSMELARTLIDAYDFPVVLISYPDRPTAWDKLSTLGHFGIVQRGCGKDILLATLENALVLAKIFQQAVVNRQLAESSEEWSRKTFDSLSDAVFVHPWREEGFSNFVDVNQHACDRYGYTKAEFLELSAQDITAPKDATTHAHPDHRKRVLKQRRTVFEAIHRAKDGSLFPVEINSSIVNLKGEEMILAVVRDISSQKRVRERLQQSEQRYRQLFQDSPIALWEEDYTTCFQIINRLRREGVTDFESYIDEHPQVIDDFAASLTILDANTATLNIFGVDDETELMRRLHETFNKETWETLRKEFIAFSDGVKEYFSETSFHGLDGKERSVALKVKLGVGGNVDVHPDEQIRGIVSMVDITEKRAHELELQASEARYRSFFENNNAVILMVDPETAEIIFANQAAVDFYGYTENELIGMKIIEINTLDSQKIRKKLKEAQKSTQNHFTFKHKLANGEIRDVEIYQSRIEFTNRSVFSLIIHDITDRVKAEEAKLELERQFLHAQKLESLGVLAGGLAHDINNYLTVILGNASIVLNENELEKQFLQPLMDIDGAARRAADLTNQMLAYAGKGRYVLESINVQSLIQEMGDMLSVSISKRANLIYEFDKNPCHIKGDRAQIQQVIMNLITNASEALENSDGTISIAVNQRRLTTGELEATIGGSSVSKVAPAPGKYICIAVEDSGVGMAPEVKERIFDPFFSTKFTGRGLGMAAVQGIVHGHKGAIDIQTSPGAGSRFMVYLPYDDSHRSVKKRQDLGTSKSVFPPDCTILIADDERSILTLGKRMLTREGVQVLTALDGVEALSLAEKHGIDTLDCVLLDLTMPNMDGLETFNALKALRPDLKVVLCSGYSEQDATQKFTAGELSGFLKKPYSLEQLKQILLDVLKHS